MGFQPGDKVRITYEGTALEASDDRYLRVSDPTGYSHYYPRSAIGDGSIGAQLVEPEYVHEGIYRAADGAVYQFDSEYHDDVDVWWIMGASWTVKFDVPVRPLVRLVPEHE